MKKLNKMKEIKKKKRQKEENKKKKKFWINAIEKWNKMKTIMKIRKEGIAIKK